MTTAYTDYLRTLADYSEQIDNEAVTRDGLAEFRALRPRITRAYRIGCFSQRQKDALDAVYLSLAQPSAPAVGTRPEEAAREAPDEYLAEYRRDDPDARTHKAGLTEHGREVLESEPTEGDVHPRGAAVGTLERLEDETYTAYGVDSKPAGLFWVKMALDLAERITNEPGLLDTITEADLDQLTEDNFHTARHAAEVARHLRKYII